MNVLEKIRPNVVLGLLCLGGIVVAASLALLAPDDSQRRSCCWLLAELSVF